MSRIDDDRQASRAAERIALQKREAEMKTREKVQSDSAFSKLVGKTVQEKQVQAQRQTTTAQSAIAKLKAEMGEASTEATHFDSAMGEAASKSDESARAANNGARAKLGDKNLSEKFRTDQSQGHEAATTGRMSDEASSGMAAKGRSEEGTSTSRAGEGRVSDSKKTNESLEEKGAANVGKGGKALGGKGELKADGESGKGSGGGGQQQGGGSGKDGAGQVPAGFRFNPALMAPVPVAQQRDMAGSERIRRIANEIAQKIVEKVRVGKNAAGASEFQIDLRTNVLKGLSIKVQSQNGRISMIFSGRDKETLKYIEEQSQGLKESLTSRGLKLQELRFETLT